MAGFYAAAHIGMVAQTRSSFSATRHAHFQLSCNGSAAALNGMPAQAQNHHSSNAL
jgi:hypothetical protein